MGTAGNLLTGPVQLFRGAAEAAEAAIVTEVGYTEDGLQFAYNDTIVNLEVDEETWPVGAVRTGVEMVITFQMAEATLQNLMAAYGLPASAYDGVTKTLTINPTSTVEYASLKAIGAGPGGTTRTYLFPKVAPRGGRTSAIRKGQKVLVPVEMQVYKPAAGAPATFKDA